MLERERKQCRDRYMLVGRTNLCLGPELPTSITGRDRVTRVKTPALERVLSSNSSDCTPFRPADLPKLGMTKLLQILERSCPSDRCVRAVRPYPRHTEGGVLTRSKFKNETL